MTNDATLKRAEDKIRHCIILSNELPNNAYSLIKGKKYIQVHHRISIFRQVFGLRGCIYNEILSNSEKEIVMKSSVFFTASSKEYILLATGHAHEFKTGHINTYSAIENCETSAVGRALGSLGIMGNGTALASAEEMTIYNNKKTLHQVK